MYSGSLGTSPKRGFLIKSQRVSAGLIATDGSPGDATPSAWRTVAQPESARTSATHSVRRCFVPRPITAHKIAHTLYSFASHGGAPAPRRAAARPAYSFASRGGGPVTDSTRLACGSGSPCGPATCCGSPCASVLDGRLPREALLLGRRRGHQRLAAREEGSPRDRGDPRRVEVGDAAALEHDGHHPAGNLERPRQPRRPVRQAEHLLDARPTRRKNLGDGERVRHLKPLRALEHDREQIGHATQVRFRLGEVEHGCDRDLDAPPRDAHAVVHLRARLALEGHVHGLGEPRLDAPDLRPAEGLLVMPERFSGHRVVELLTAAEDRQLLARLRAATLPEVEVERVALDPHDEPLDRLERAHEVLGHQYEGRAHAVGESGARRSFVHQEPERYERAEDPGVRAGQNVTDGAWAPKTPRSRSQISPSVTCASTARTMQATRFWDPRAAASSASSALSASPRSRFARTRTSFSARASPTAGSTWKRLVGGDSSVTYSLTPTTMRALPSTSRWYRYAASWISRCMNGMARTAPPSSSIFRM